MKFIHSDLGQRRAGDRVQFTLQGSSANVRLLDSSNFSNYRNGRSYRGVMGRAIRSPSVLQIPRSGRWHAVVDMQGLRGNVNASIQAMPGPLPALREAPLATVPGLAQRSAPLVPNDAGEVFDVFVSHASEDKDEVARPLAAALRERGVKVWFDDFELRIGDSLRRKIDRGLASSRFGLVVLSPSFIAKGWTGYELDGMVSLAVSKEQVLLPIWHKLSHAEVMAYSPSLADKVARNTTTHAIDDIADEIAEVVRGVFDAEA